VALRVLRLVLGVMLMVVSAIMMLKLLLWVPRQAC
jgi:hypothetical protein